MILCLCVVSQAQPRKKTSLVSPTTPQCLKILKKVAFNIASEASYVYILNGQKLIKNVKIGPFWRVFENLKLAVKQLPDRSILKGQKLLENAKNQNGQNSHKLIIFGILMNFWPFKM